MGRWVFSQLRGDDVRRDPNEAELFKTAQTGEGEYAGTDALVREVLQNAIDAAAGDGPVRVRLAVHEDHEAPHGDRLAEYFARLGAALKPRGVECDSRGVPQLPCRYLVVEDFGTHGLEGEINLFQDPPPEDPTKQYFYWFWRNIGRSSKTGDDLGRWGLGKTVYRAVSSASCMFGLSIRKSDRRRLLMGQAVLQIHEHDAKEYKPEGYWCASQDASGLPAPIEDPRAIEEFRHEWHITRTDEPGLSVVSPFVPEELQAERLLQAVAVHFFVSILRGQLEVTIVGRDLGTVTLDRGRIAGACRNITWDGPQSNKRHTPPPIEFTRECLAGTPQMETEVLGKERIPEFNESTLASETLARLRRQFANGELVSLRVRLHLPRRDGHGEDGRLDVYVQRTSDGRRRDHYAVREGMTITKIRSQAGRRGVQSLLLVEAGPLSRFLGDTEGPAHEDWDQSAERPERIWARGWKGRVKFVRRIADTFVELLTPPATEPDFDLLSEFFTVESVNGRQPRPKPGRELKQRVTIEPLSATPKWFHINPQRGGFMIRHNARVEMPDNPRLRVAVAYDIPRGDPLRHWSRLDFEIGNGPGTLRPKGRLLKAQSMQGNIVLLKDIQEGFEFSVDGFDRHRDLYIRVDDASEHKDNNHDQAGELHRSQADPTRAH